MLRTIIPALVSVAVACPAYAQIVPKPDGQWRGALGAGATATSGNNESLNYSINGHAVKRTHVDKLGGYLQAVYGRRDVDGTTQRTSDQTRTGIGYSRDFNDRLFGFGMLDFDRNNVIDLDLRTVVAGGVGYHVVKREGHTFDISTGPAYIHERYSTDKVRDTTRDTKRDMVEWLIAEESNHALTRMVSFRQRLSYYANLNEGGEHRLSFDTGLVLKVNDRWSATITFSNRYQSNPVPGVEKNDMLLVTGLQYVFNP
jgi:putative salt-induced outer membrane protein YdiY